MNTAGLKPVPPNDAWGRAKGIFEQLLETPGAQRAEQLEFLCAGDESLRREVETLLSAHDSAGEFLSESSFNAGALFDAVETAAASQAIGECIGRYRLVERLGEGGFGEVFLAKQEEPVRREVALKVVKPGMDSRQIIARFEAERQAIARMDHPHIAKVFDAGQTALGRPYFVMEIVRGLPITKHCSTEGLGLRERLELFIAVCDAVQHAHQRGIIHRDLKPSNILVTNGAPRIIDFGVAKAITPDGVEMTQLTDHRQFIGTPAYMSPEQAQESGDVDTRSDVYSLGVVLYELLTQHTPFDRQVSTRSGLLEWQRAIRELDPPRPSERARADSKIAHDDSTRMLHQIMPRDLRGELDWIVMKCLEKDRSRRYATVSELATDIQRFLRNEAVNAGPPSAGYRLRKFAARHRAGILASAAVLSALVIGLGFAIFGLLAAQRSQKQAAESLIVAQENARQAREAAERANAVRDFLQGMLAQANPRESGRTSVTVRDALEQAARQIDGSALKDQPDTLASVRLVIGRAYRELAMLNEAMTHIDAALAAFEQLRGPADASVAEALQERGSVFKAQGKHAKAEADFRRALSLRRAAPSDPDKLVAILNDTGTSLIDQRSLDEADKLLTEALELVTQPAFDHSARRGEVLNNLGWVAFYRQKLPEAEDYFRRAIQANRTVLGPDHPNLATNLDNLAQMLVARGAVDEGEAAYRDALRIRREVYGDHHPEIAVTLHNLAVLLHGQNRMDECETNLRESLRILKAAHGWANSDTLVVMNSLVSVFAARQNLGEAESTMLDAFEGVRERPEINDAERKGLAERIAQFYQAIGNATKAAEWTQTAAKFSANPERD
ncbi:MAG: tetratricopeptide repeat protein [Phycisphaerales bacterium]|nr:tetratricopeptide repeat protein [Phycisphaerales bacterium]